MKFKRVIFIIVILIQEITSHGQIFRITNGPDSKIFKIYNWELYLVKNPNSIYKDALALKVRNSMLVVDSLDLSAYSGVCWFRTTLKFDSNSVKLPASFKININGAAEFFVNSKQIHKIGLVSAEEESEEIISAAEEICTYNFEHNKDMISHVYQHPLYSLRNSTRYLQFSLHEC